MSLHRDWDDVIDDMFRIIALPAAAYNVYESFAQKHPNAKILVRCGACAGGFGLLLRHFQKHHFEKGQNPVVSVRCPHCNASVTQHDVDYVNVQKA